MKELGYELGDNAFEDAFIRFKALADLKKHVYDEDIEALVDQEIASAHDRIKVVALTVIAGTGGPQKATITLDVDGKQQTHEFTGDGPVDAIFKAIKAIIPHDARLPLYQVSAVTEGTDAQAEVSVRLEADGKTVTGRGSDTDTMVASARAYVSALEQAARPGGTPQAGDHARVLRLNLGLRVSAACFDRMRINRRLGDQPPLSLNASSNAL